MGIIGNVYMIKQIKKNVIFIVLDSLRYDRLGFSGHSPSPSPILDELLSSGLVFTNCYSTGCPTEFAYPSLTTSTLPLDHGGYGEGIKNREVSIAEIFHKEGYRTGIFFEDYFRSTTKYDRGFNDVFLLYDLNRFMADINDTIPYYANKLKNGEKTFIECTNEMNKYLPVL